MRTPLPHPLSCARAVAVALLALALLSTNPTSAAPPAPLAATRTTATRPLAITFDGGLGGPTGLFGATVGYHVTDAWEVATGFGLGMTGYQVALLGRYALPMGHSDLHAWIFGLGPSIGFRSEALGMRIEHSDEVAIDPEKLYFTAWLNAELGWEGRFRWGGVLRVMIGAELRIADNQRHLCDGADTGADSRGSGNGCNPYHLAPGSTVAGHLFLPYLQFSFGWAF